MVKRHDVQEIGVGEVEPGFALVIPGSDGGPPLQFNVEKVGFRHVPDQGTTYTFTSEPVPPEDEPWVLEYPAGSRVLRLLRTYDDGK